LELLDVLVVDGVLFAVRSVRILWHKHAHAVELLLSHLKVGVEESPALASDPLLGKAFFDDGTIKCLFPLAIVLSRELREEGCFSPKVFATAL